MALHPQKDIELLFFIAFIIVVLKQNKKKIAILF